MVRGINHFGRKCCEGSYFGFFTVHTQAFCHLGVYSMFLSHGVTVLVDKWLSKGQVRGVCV